MFVVCCCCDNMCVVVVFVGVYYVVEYGRCDFGYVFEED